MRDKPIFDDKAAKSLGWLPGCTCRFHTTYSSGLIRIQTMGCQVHEPAPTLEQSQSDAGFTGEAVSPKSTFMTMPNLPPSRDPRPTTRTSVMGEVASGPLWTVAPTDDGRIAFHSAMGFDFRLDQASARALSQCLTAALSQEVAA